MLERTRTTESALKANSVIHSYGRRGEWNDVYHRMTYREAICKRCPATCYTANHVNAVELSRWPWQDPELF
jgi:hypothetical protein